MGLLAEAHVELWPAASVRERLPLALICVRSRVVRGLYDRRQAPVWSGKFRS